jgi:hypothetical protein
VGEVWSQFGKSQNRELVMLGKTKEGGPLFNLPPIWHTLIVKILRSFELKSGHSDNGPAWIGYATQSKSGRTLYFNGSGLMKLKGQRRGDAGGNYIDMETGESF